MTPRSFGHFLLIGLVLLGAGAARPAKAAEAPMPALPPGSEAETLARAAIEQLVRALGLALQALPQYELPRLNDRGDIVIRRTNPTVPPVSKRRPAPDETAT